MKSVLTKLNGNKPKTAKDAIIHTLSTTFPLNAKKLHHTLEREQGMNITYQAVHKALLELENEHILTKHENAWQLNPVWLDSQENFIRQTRQKYAGNKNKYNIDLNYEGPQTFEFDNHTDFSVETAKLIADKILSQNRESTIFLMKYGWWTLKFQFEHLILLYRLVQSKSEKSLYIIKKVTPFGKWVHQQYQRVGGHGIIGIDFPFNEDVLIQGDWFLQVNFTPESMETIEKYWNKWKSLEDTFKEFGLKDEPKMKITVTVTKNPTMARFLSQEMEKYVEGAKKHAK